MPGDGRYEDDVKGGRAYWVVAPVGPSGIAFLGDEGKYASLGKKRITTLTDDGAVRATVAFAKREDQVTLHGYSPSAPHAVAARGAVGSVEYDDATRLFRVVVRGSDGVATIVLTLR